MCKVKVWVKGRGENTLHLLISAWESTGCTNAKHSGPLHMSNYKNNQNIPKICIVEIFTSLANTSKDFLGTEILNNYLFISKPYSPCITCTYAEVTIIILILVWVQSRKQCLDRPLPEYKKDFCSSSAWVVLLHPDICRSLLCYLRFKARVR